MSTIQASVISTFIEDTFRKIKCYVFGKDDIQEPTQAAPYGIDSNPIAEMIAIYAQTAEAAEPVIIGYINQDQLAAPGEVRLYSTNNDADLKTYLWLKNDGTMEIGGNVDNAVRYSKLETAFNALKDDFNNFVSTYNSHTHPYIDSGSPSTSSPTTSAGTSSSADITPAKITEIKTS